MLIRPAVGRRPVSLCPVALTYLFLVLALAVLAPTIPAAAQQPGKAARPPETVRVVMESNTQVLDDIRNVLTGAGLIVVDKEDADATLKVDWGHASVSLTNAPDWAPMGSTHHLGVEEHGSFDLTSKDASLYAGTFKGVNSCFINMADNKAMEECIEQARRRTDLRSGLEGMVKELWPDRMALLALARAESEADRASAMGDLKQRLASPQGAALLAPLVNMLRAPSPKLRESAVKAVVALKDPRLVDLLLPALQDRDSALQGGAASVLGQLGDPKAAAPLVVLLQKGSPGGQEQAAEALGSLGAPEGVGPLISALDGGSLGVQAAAAKALGRLKDPRARKPLLAALAEAHPDVRRAAATALGDMADPGAVAPLVAALRDESAGTRVAAATALGKIGDKAAVEPLLACLKDSSSDMRAAAATGLGRLGGASNGQHLLPLLGDSSPEVRAAAAESLGQIKPPEALKPLTKALQSDKAIEVRIAAAKALGRFDAPEAAKALKKAAKDKSPEVREAVAQSLKTTGGS